VCSERISSAMVIAIVGRSCVGKSTVATILGERWGLPVCHCGESVKEYAKSRSRRVSELTKEDHYSIDEATRRVASSTKSMIIEGTFLDIVLASIPDVMLIRLTCSETERQRRFANRGSGDPDAYRERDAGDDALRTLLYDQSGVLSTCGELDTTRLTANEVSDHIAKVRGL
jgi:cytidylate kinase